MPCRATTFNHVSTRIIDIRLENQGRFERGIESAIAGLECLYEFAKDGCQVLLDKLADALEELVDALCKIGIQRWGFLAIVPGRFEI